MPGRLLPVDDVPDAPPGTDVPSNTRINEVKNDESFERIKFQHYIAIYRKFFTKEELTFDWRCACMKDK